MGYDFKPRNKSAEDYQLGAFSWPFMLDAGLGLVLGTGKGFRPGEFIWIERPDGLCVQYNDGAKVSAKEAKELAKVARWIARIEQARINQFALLTQSERDTIEADKEEQIYKKPWHPDVIERFRKFADWCDKSGGFKIN